jgi:hypothetical protein
LQIPSMHVHPSDCKLISIFPKKYSNP